MTVIQFGPLDRSRGVGDPELLVEFQLPDSIQRGAGLHRLRFPVKLDSRKTLPAGVPLYITTQVSIGGSNDWLGFAFADQPIVTYDQPFDGHLILPLSDEQFAILEDRRAGSDLAFYVLFSVTLGHPTTDRPNLWPSSHNSDQTMLIQSGPWQRLMEQSSSGFSLAVVVPVPLGKDSASLRAGESLRKALRKVNAGEYDDAVVSARKAIDALDGDTTWAAEKAVAATKPGDRTLVERRTMLRHALFSLASPAAHGDDRASEIQWDRAGAMAVIAGVSALVATWDR